MFVDRELKFFKPENKKNQQIISLYKIIYIWWKMKIKFIDDFQDKGINLVYCIYFSVINTNLDKKQKYLVLITS